jgi:GxxExxY protein
MYMFLLNLFQEGLLPVVDGKVVVEAKAMDRLAEVHVAQVNSYHRLPGPEVGLLLNFRAWPLKQGLKRVVSIKT